MLIFVNLPVGDLAGAVAFYEGIGATRNPRFSDDTAACMVLSPTVHVMLLTHDKFRQFTPRPIAGRETIQALLCISTESRAAVDAMAEAADRCGGRADPAPPQDHGFMCSRSFEDPDGHVWEAMWMDPAVAAGDAPPA